MKLGGLAYCLDHTVHVPQLTDSLDQELISYRYSSCWCSCFCCCYFCWGDLIKKA